ncbi:MAG: ABC transporter ATP-binding protein [Pseudomonadota bacterium]
MIGSLIRVAGPDARKPLRANMNGLILEAVLTGIGFVLLVPILRALLSGDTATATTWLIVFVAVSVVYIALRFRTQLDGYVAAVGLARALFKRLGTHIASLPLGWFGPDRVGQLSRMTGQGVIDVIGVPAHLLRPLLTAITTPATVVLLMFIFDWRLALAALITAPVAAFTMRLTGNLFQKKEHGLHAANAEATGRIVEFAQAQPVLRAFGRSENDLGKLGDSLDQQLEAERSVIVSAFRGLLSFVFVLQIGFTIILLFGANLALGGKIDAAELVAILVLTARYIEPLIGAADLESAMRISQNSLKRMDDLFAVEPLPEPAQSTPPANASIELKSVDFSYDEIPLLKDLSFQVPERTMTAIVGPSGSGKTTLLRLIARFWDIGAGAVAIGGVDVRDMSTEDLMRQISIVFQDIYLFDGTILENIRIGRPEASDAEVERAAQLACVDEITNRLPEGLNARVGEGGSILSGGERQRISIARAILKDAPIILLDEATAALDPINESAVQRALVALTRNKTIVIVAHRLQTVRAADQILVLENGTIAERGSHDQLIVQGGRYADFWNERKRAAGWRLAAENAA